MAVIQKDIFIPDKLMPDVRSGKINIMGLAKNADNGKIATVFPDSDQSSVLRRKKK